MARWFEHRAARVLRRRWRLLAVVGGVLALVLVAADLGLDEPLRRYAVREVNARLEGYHLEIGHLDVRPLRFGAVLRDVVLTQDAHPDPPVAHISSISTGIHWRALLRGSIVADVHIDQPALHVNRAQLLAETEDEVPLDEKGWQEVIALAPLKVNRLAVTGGSATYRDRDGAPPIEVTAFERQILAGRR
ncbi:MAG: hypothetical protein L0027_16325 [Candidatus Rokubacteria bacterium]|nr:hypothetical protein [Candidatus Rokubacteria bacterium]